MLKSTPSINKVYRVLSVLPLLGHPRDSKRIKMLQDGGFIVEAVAFERDYHNGRLPLCEIHRLGKIDHGRYLKRIFKLLKALPKIRSLIRKNDIIYASGPDMAFIAAIAGFGLNRPLVLEVGDVRELEVAKGFIGSFVRLLVRFTANSSRLLVSTASGFIDEYYRGWLNVSTPALIIENKLENDSFTSLTSNLCDAMKGCPFSDRPLRIGYFGVLRDAWSLDVLEKLARACPEQVEIIIAGLPMVSVDLPELAKKYKNIEFRGTYRSPQDLPALYGEVDMVWACYPYPKRSEWNWRWARTNRFYESCYFKKPMIVLAGSGDAHDVKHYSIGMLVKDDVVNAITSIKAEDIIRWDKNILQLNKSLYVYTDEIEKLSSSIRTLLNG